MWRSSKKRSENLDWDDENLDENLAPQPLVCHHFAAIHVQTMWKGKLARRRAELRKLKKKKRSMRRRKAEGQKPRVVAPASDDESERRNRRRGRMRRARVEETNRLLDLSREQSERYDTGATSHERGFGVSIKVTRVFMTRYL